jgi:hypothetical protein
LRVQGLGFRVQSYLDELADGVDHLKEPPHEEEHPGRDVHGFMDSNTAAMHHSRTQIQLISEAVHLNDFVTNQKVFKLEMYRMAPSPTEIGNQIKYETR